jgi:hypothetical protein
MPAAHLSVTLRDSDLLDGVVVHHEVIARTDSDGRYDPAIALLPAVLACDVDSLAPLVERARVAGLLQSACSLAAGPRDRPGTGG